MLQKQGFFSTLFLYRTQVNVRLQNTILKALPPLYGKLHPQDMIEFAHPKFLSPSLTSFSLWEKARMSVYSDKRNRIKKAPSADRAFLQ